MAAGERIEVAAGILTDARGRVLLCERLGDAAFAGLWEFPGGKLADGESATAALVRELDEELGIAVRDFRHFLRVQHDYGPVRVGIDFFLVVGWRGTPRGRDGQQLAWQRPADIAAKDLMPANEPVLLALCEGRPAGRSESGR